jgi:hypothetical protein
LSLLKKHWQGGNESPFPPLKVATFQTIIFISSLVGAFQEIVLGIGVAMRLHQVVETPLSKGALCEQQHKLSVQLSLI